MFIVATNPLCRIEWKASYFLSSLFTDIIYCQSSQKLGNLYMKNNYCTSQTDKIGTRYLIGVVIDIMLLDIVWEACFLSRSLRLPLRLLRQELGRQTNGPRSCVLRTLGSQPVLFRTSTPWMSTHRAPVTPDIEDRLIYGNEGVQGRGGANNGRAAATVIESNDSDCSSWPGRRKRK